MVHKKYLLSAITGTAVLGSLLVTSAAFAAGPGVSGAGLRAPSVLGTVSAVHGEILTVTSKGLNGNATPTTYSVDVTNATITKGGSKDVAPTTVTASGVAVGDMIVAWGTVSGTNVTATTVRDGVMGSRGMDRGMGAVKSKTTTPATAPILTGNGQPVTGGTVTAINGSKLTMTNKSNVTYTVDATGAAVEKGNVASAVSSITVGDNVIVQGTVNGTSVTATSIMDTGTPPAQPTAGGAASQPHKGGVGGFLGSVGGFFHNLFGFF
ncbi:MAG: hypothetical protein WCI89_03875 [bacterium]